MRRQGEDNILDEPVWVKFSTGFKKELATLDGYALKVFLYIGLSVSFANGNAYPGLRKIAKDTGMAINTVQKAVEDLERMGLLTVRRRVGASNFYQPSRYITIGTVSRDDTLPHESVSPDDTLPRESVSKDDTAPTRVYHENEKLYQKNAELYHDQEGNLHNKNNKIKQEDIYIAQSDFQKVLSALEELCGPVAMDTTRLINTWLEKHTLKRIQQAIDVAGERRARSPKYIDQVLISWEENGYPPSRAQQIFARAFKPRRGKNGEDKPRYEIPEYSEAELATIAEINRMSDL